MECMGEGGGDEWSELQLISLVFDSDKACHKKGQSGPGVPKLYPHKSLGKILRSNVLSLNHPSPRNFFFY
jgi:hypothetical protein